MNKLSISKGWVTLILGPASGLWIIVQHPDEVNTIIGAVVTIVTAISALQHDLAEQQIKANAPQTIATPENTTLVVKNTSTATPSASTTPVTPQPKLG